MSFIVNRFVKLTDFLHRHKFGVTLVLSAIFIFVSSHFALADAAADAAAAAAAAGSAVTDTSATLVSFMNSFLPLALATILSIIAMVIGKIIVVVIGMVIIPILGYNGFATSGVVDIGWPLVRDVVNMFVVIVLLVIAIKTILGLGKANWEQQLPRLFLAIVAVNFSRTICLLLIDFGQVIMWTFVSAIRDIAAGNFVNLFQMNAFMGFGESWLASQGNNGMNAFMFLGGAYATVVLLSMVLAVMLLLAVIFIYRIVILWVLIIMSPLAFFMGGISDVLGNAGGQYAEWWKKMIGAVTLGPILTFFLWLALAAASSGPIATSEGFSTVMSVDTGTTLATLPPEIFAMDKLLSLFIAIVLITVGFQAASTQAGALGGIAAQFVTEKGGMDLAKGLAAAPAALGYRGAKAAGGLAVAGGIGLARQIDRLTEGGIGKELGGALIQGASALRDVPIIGGYAARNLAAVGGKIQKTSSEDEAEARKGATETVKGMSDGQRNEAYNAIISGKADSMSVANRDIKDDMVHSWGKKGTRDAFKDEEEAKVNQEEARTGNVRSSVIADTVATAGYEDKAREEHTKAGLTGTNLDAAIAADVAKQQEKAIKAKVTAPVKAKTDKMDDEYLKFVDKNEDRLVDAGGDPAKEDILKNRSRLINKLDDEQLDKVVSDPKFNPANIEGEPSEKAWARLDKQPNGYRKNDKGEEVPKTVGDDMRRGIGVSRSTRDAMPGVIGRDVANNKMDTRQITEAIKSGFLDLNKVPAGGMNKDVADKIARAMIDSGKPLDPSKISDPANRTQFINSASSELNRDRASAKTDRELVKIDKHVEELTDSVEKAHGFNNRGTFAQEDETGHKQGGDRSLAVNVKQNITYINKLPAGIGAGSEAAMAATSQLDASDISEMIKKMHSVDATERADIQKALRALQPMVQANTGVAGTPDHARLSAVDRRIADALAIPPSAFT